MMERFVFLRKSYHKYFERVLNMLLVFQQTFTCSKSKIETLEKGVEYVQS